MQQGPNALFLVFLFCSFVLFFWSAASRPGAISSGLTLSGATGAAIGAGSGTCGVLVRRLVDVAGLSIASMPARTLALFGFSVDTVVDCSAIAEATTMN